MPGNYVFPGGVVDSDDKDLALWKKHADIDLQDGSGLLDENFDEEKAIAYGVAAIRETFEEAGVFLASRPAQIRENLDRIVTQRMATPLPRGWLRELVTSEGWILTFSALRQWAHWITPKRMPRRFDTRFFLVFMPQDQECSPDNNETTHGIWISPEKALIGNLSKELPLSPPTLVTLNQLIKYSGLDDLKKEVGTRTWGEPLYPRLVPLKKGAVIIEPWDPMINEEVEIDPQMLEEKALAVGEPFSRLWNHEGIWRPVSI
jgi:8-oxo-dGTP pyrophosphatase MutT (NUDIX family)